MKRLLPYLLSLALLLALAACGDPAAEVSPSATPSPPADSTPPVVSVQPVAEARYFFVHGLFLGSWEDGRWHSAADGGFTLGQLFDQTYIAMGQTMGAARFPVGSTSGFDYPDLSALLAPFGIQEGEEFICKLPGQFTGEAAALSVPTENFYTYFDGSPYYLISNVALDPQYPTAQTAHLPDSLVAKRLAEAGIDCDLSRASRSTLVIDLDGDGLAEELELIANPASGEVPPAAGDDIFYILLLSDGEDVSTITAQVMDYTDEETAYFYPGDLIFADLDGDGSTEIILQHAAWEWGHYSAFTLQNARWTEVLTAEYGM